MTKKSYVAENGLTIGLAGLALLVIFAIALPRWVHGGDTRAIVLPETLSSGYKAAPADVDSRYAAMAKEIGDALGTPAASRIYGAADGQSALIVQATRAAGEALLPVTTGKFSKIGDDVCMQTQAVLGQQALLASTCRHTEGELTVWATYVDGKNTDNSAGAAKYADEVFSKIS